MRKRGDWEQAVPWWIRLPGLFGALVLIAAVDSPSPWASALARWVWPLGVVFLLDLAGLLVVDVLFPLLRGRAEGVKGDQPLDDGLSAPHGDRVVEVDAPLDDGLSSSSVSALIWAEALAVGEGDGGDRVARLGCFLARQDIPCRVALLRDGTWEVVLPVLGHRIPGYEEEHLQATGLTPEAALLALDAELAGQPVEISLEGGQIRRFRWLPRDRTVC